MYKLDRGLLYFVSAVFAFSPYFFITMANKVHAIKKDVIQIEKFIDSRKEYSPYHDNDPDDLYRNWQKNSYRWRKM